jgi:hypothetical protein
LNVGNSFFWMINCAIVVKNVRHNTRVKQHSIFALFHPNIKINTDVFILSLLWDIYLYCQQLRLRSTACLDYIDKKNLKGFGAGLVWCEPLHLHLLWETEKNHEKIWVSWSHVPNSKSRTLPLKIRVTYYHYIMVFWVMKSCSMVGSCNTSEKHWIPCSTLKMRAAFYSDTFVNTWQTTCYQNPEDHSRDLHRRRQHQIAVFIM